ncbi:hypothetical protein C8Q80DRAFT_53649 [Daedaleopsis nitida]|nr:hypothetical protein C8Q80DRAFT_53649 [Daedaleopsis nitida]
MFRDVAVYHIDREQSGRKRRRSPDSHECRSSKRPKVAVPSDTLSPAMADGPASMEFNQPSSYPSILQHVRFGINEVTRHLESLASSYRKSVTADGARTREVTSVDSDAMSKARIVIACRGDVDPPILIGHLPNLVAACNSLRKHTTTSQRTFLVPMPKGLRAL